MIANFLKSGRYARHLRQQRRVLAQQLEWLSQCVQDAFPEGTRLSRPSGGMVLWVELPEDVDTLRLYDEASRSGVDFVPGVMFSASGRYRNGLRLNGGYPVNAATEAAIRRLGNLIRTGILEHTLDRTAGNTGLLTQKHGRRLRTAWVATLLDRVRSSDLLGGIGFLTMMLHL